MITALILTLNEEQHIARCIDSLRCHCSEVIVVDSGSTDQTVEIAKSRGATVLFNSWTNYSTQMNFAIKAAAENGGWLLRIDADEVIDESSIETLTETVNRADVDVDGLAVNRRIFFLGKRIKYGSIEPSWQLRLWRNGRGRCEQRWMDEHIQVEGKTAKSSIVISDRNLNSITWWIEKHNSYASREAIDIIIKKNNLKKN